MLTRLSIRNFQSHKQTDLDLSTGITAVTGQSDAGKSSVVRAVEWVLGIGPALRSHWGGDTEAYLEVGGQKIGRERTISKNSYIVDGDCYDKVGKVIPDKAKDLLAIDPSINVQGQHDSTFLLASSPGEVARSLNKAARLDVIDSVLSRGESLIRSTRAEAGARKTEAEELKFEVARYEPLAGIEEDLVSTERLGMYVEATTNAIRKLEEGIIGLEGVASEKDRLKRTVGLEIKPAEKLAERYADLSERRAGLLEDIHYLSSITEEVGRLKKRLTILGAEFEELMPNVCPLCGQEGKR